MCILVLISALPLVLCFVFFNTVYIYRGHMSVCYICVLSLLGHLSELQYFLIVYFSCVSGSRPRVSVLWVHSMVVVPFVIFLL